MQLILGSQSPRRRELLASIDLPFRAVSINADESFPPTLIGEDIPTFISRAKARAYAYELAHDEVLITSDTIVWVDGEMLGKPVDENDAKRMLALLSGKTHQVYTAVTFRTAPHSSYPILEEDNMHTFVCKTDVTFKSLSSEEIDYYIATYHPLDKAGAYGIQEWIGYIGVTSIQGSYFNVVGFPIQRVYSYLQELQHTNL